MLQHSNHLEAEYGAGPHTISVPRLRPADGSELSIKPPFEVDDDNFKKLVAIIRIAVPYTGMILSTRESPQMRDELLKVSGKLSVTESFCLFLRMSGSFWLSCA